MGDDVGEQTLGEAGRGVAARRQQVGTICSDLIGEAREPALDTVVDCDRSPHRGAVMQVSAVDEAIEEHRHQRRCETGDDARHPDVDEHGEDAEHDAAAEERELEIVARSLTAATLVSEGEPPVHRGVPGGAECEGRDERDQRLRPTTPIRTASTGRNTQSPLSPTSPNFQTRAEPGTSKNSDRRWRR